MADLLQTTLGVQRALTHLGFEPGPHDGVMGPHTRAALANFQAARGLAAHGVLCRETHAGLKRLVMRGFRPLGATAPRKACAKPSYPAA